MRAKFFIQSITKTASAETLEMLPVTPGKFGPSGESEDNTYARWSPSGNLRLTITNPDLIGTFTPGEAYYLDFTKAP
jgi:hypothetical protein